LRGKLRLYKTFGKDSQEVIQMKSVILILILTICCFVFSQAVHAASDQQIASEIYINVYGIFSIEWESDPTYVSYPNGGPVYFSSVSPASTLNYADGHTNMKSDIAFICRSSESIPWGVKTNVTGDTPNNLLYYMGQPTWNPGGSGSVPTDGTLGDPTPNAGDPWPFIKSNWLIYGSGSDSSNLPYGTYVGMNVGVYGPGLSSGQHTNTVIFTMTQNV